MNCPKFKGRCLIASQSLINTPVATVLPTRRSATTNTGNQAHCRLRLAINSVYTFDMKEKFYILALLNNHPRIKLNQ